MGPSIHTLTGIYNEAHSTSTSTFAKTLGTDVFLLKGRMEIAHGYYSMINIPTMTITASATTCIPTVASLAYN